MSLAAKGYNITLDTDLFNFMVDAGTIRIGPGGTATLGGILIGIDWSAAGATIGAVLSNPVTITVAAGMVAIGGVAWSLANNKAQNDQFREAVRRHERECGKSLSADERQRLHRSITKKRYSLDEVVQEAIAIFGCPKPKGN